MPKIVISTGSGFWLSHKAVMRYAELKGIKLTPYVYDFDENVNGFWVKYDPTKGTECEYFIHYFIDTDLDVIQTNMPIKQFYRYTIKRTDTILIQVVEELYVKEKSRLKIVEIPDDVDWYIDKDESGPECIRERSRFWS